MVMEMGRIMPPLAQGLTVAMAHVLPSPPVLGTETSSKNVHVLVLKCCMLISFQYEVSLTLSC